MMVKKNAELYGGGGVVARAISGRSETLLTVHHLISVGKGAKDIPVMSGVAAAEVEAQHEQAKEARA